ncbi:MAG: DUF2079 domain-containing protein [Candidatus Kerfeldbacteria bacterium]|nr:DUF2079 domain-containing protein [Candidatus Kerfeldbacteria bacterium]
MKKYAPEILLGSFVALWVIVLCVVAAIQYHFFLYDALDLGIYTQVFWNTVHGRPFAYTFNNYSYLADHREWIIILLAPVFALIQHPLTLVVIQIVALASTVIPLRGIVLHVYGESIKARYAAAGVGALMLLHPAIQHMALYEFHILIFVVPFSALAWYAYVRKKYTQMIVWTVLLLCVREDVGFMVAGIGALACVRAQNRVEKIRAAVYAVVGLAWSVVMIGVGGYFFPSGSEKFLVFYPQLGTSMSDAVYTLFTQPLQAFSPLFAYDHAWILIVCIASVGALCLWSPWFLLPAIPQLLLMLLIPKNMLNSVLHTHYAAPIVIWLVIASVYGWKTMRKRLRSSIAYVVTVIACVVVVMHGVLLSGVAFSIARAAAHSTVVELVSAHSALERITSQDHVVVSHTFATALSTREYVYPMLQVFTGKDHYAESVYDLPDRVDWIVFAPRDLIEMTINFPFSDVAGGWARIQQLIEENNLVAVVRTPDLVMYGRGEVHALEPIAYTQRIDTEISLHTLTHCGTDSARTYLSCSLASRAGDEVGSVHGVVQWFDAEEQRVATEWIPFVDGRLQPSHLWSADEETTIIFPLRTVENASAATLTLVLVQKEEAKVFLSHHAVDLSTLPHASVDLTQLLLQ